MMKYLNFCLNENLLYNWHFLFLKAYIAVIVALLLFVAILLNNVIWSYVLK